jgi:hypothetical protein
MPFFSLLMPKSFQKKYPKEMRNLRLNSRKLTTPFDIHETLKHFLNFESPVSSKLDTKETKIDPPRGISLLNYISPNRTCEDAQIEAHWCSCLNWINLNIKSNFSDSTSIYFDDEYKYLLDNDLNDLLNNSITKQSGRLNYKEYEEIQKTLSTYTKSALTVAQKSIEFMNSLIDEDLKVFCEKIRLQSIVKISKLDLNKKLLLFKESRDIHGREAIFHNELNLTNSSNTSSLMSLLVSNTIDNDFLRPLRSLVANQTNKFNLTNKNSQIDNRLDSYVNAEIIFQIVVTTWPGNATYEISFKYDFENDSYKFNKNEISRINNYNSTSSCMTDKRPDLRQFCFCKF